MSKENNIKVGIIGLGPVGMVLADQLKRAGCEVALCVRNEVKLNKIKNDGIVLEHVLTSKSKFKRVYKTIREFKPLDIDYLVIATKTYQVPAILEDAACLNSEKLTVVAAQNGIDVEDLLIPTFGESKIVRMIVNYAGKLISPNTTKVEFFTPPNYVGSIDDAKTDEAQTFADLLNSVSLTTSTVGSYDILKRSWEKAILNSCLSALCGVGRLTMAEAMKDPDSVELIEQNIKEGVIVAETEKILFPHEFIRNCMRYLKNGGDHFPSLALDLINNRETEIDYLNGKIVEYGRKHYVRTSLNLSFTNMVKAMTNKNIISRIPGPAGRIPREILDKGIIKKNTSAATYSGKKCFLGIDLGSAYSKFTVIDDTGTPLFRYSLLTLTNDRQAQKNVMETVASNFDIVHSCATGYGRKYFAETDLVKTEINCAAVGVSFYHNGEKNIIDIGGEDIKIIKCDDSDHVSNFYMNDKCAAGTGSFLSEIAERSEISIAEMSSLASHSDFDKELNSFCTVFAKTEIMNWMFDGLSPQDISRGIYISIANKVAKMRLEPGLKTFMIGGVIEHHPYLKDLLNEKFKMDIQVIDNPQFVVSQGAALIARKFYNNKLVIGSNSNQQETVNQ